MDPLERYRRHLSSFGIAEPGGLLAELRDRDRGGLRCFAYTGGGGLRYKAIATPEGLVRPAWRVEDDWYGFLRAAGDGAAAAGLIAWLESDGSLPPESLPADGSGGLLLPAEPWQALAPGGPAPAGVDPALWQAIAAPELAASGCGLRFAAFFLPGGPEPLRVAILARPGAPAAIELMSAGELLAEAAGGREEAEAEAARRARRVLAEGSAGEKLWALGLIAERCDRDLLPAVAALLLAPGEERGPRLRAAGLLADWADPAAIPPLAAALRQDPDAAVRRACAQGLGRLGGRERSGEWAAGALAAAWREEPDPLVRAEIVHALAAIGGIAARAALAAIAAGERDEALARLAAHYFEIDPERTTP